MPPLAYVDDFWEPGENITRSPCHNAEIYAWYCDGVLTGSCTECDQNVVRKNPKTGAIEKPKKTLTEEERNRTD